MHGQSGNKGLWWLTVACIGLPVFFYLTGDFPRRTILKESISLLILLSLSLMSAQFFLSGINRRMFNGCSMGRIITIHKVLGYSLLIVVLLHPFLLVLPRKYEAGTGSMDALFTIVSTVNTTGVALGMSAWILMLLLGLTSLFRNQIPMSYNAWRRLHGLLAVPCIIVAICHSINLGRHVNSLLSVYFVLFAVTGVLLLIKRYMASLILEQGTVR
ncbi:ferric reductase-like transmembrane domain-containing protein [Desulforhopalus sp. 52FAK]